MFFGGQGGFPFNNGPNNSNVDNKKFYELLGVEKDAEDSQIKKAYKKKAMEHHPDRGGDAEIFKEISKAYEVLIDKEKRNIYDQMGEEGLSNNGMNSSSANDIFSHFFNGGDDGPFGGGMGGPFGRRQSQQKRTTDDVGHHLEVDLKDLYLGKKKILKLNRKKVVKTGETIVNKTCSECDGKGHVIEIRRMGPMIQQVQRQCPKCNGKGKIVTGKKLVNEATTIELDIEKGMKEGDRIIKYGMADEDLHLEPGNLVFIIRETNNNKFERKGNHLITKKDILLCDALCGCEFTFTHMDNSKFLVSNDNIVKHNNLYTILDKGMPVRNRPGEFGNLYIQFNIIYPEYNHITPEVRATLKNLLPNNKDSIPNKNELENTMLMEQEMPMNFNEQNMNDDDDDEHGHQEGVNCQQQ